MFPSCPGCLPYIHTSDCCSSAEEHYFDSRAAVADAPSKAVGPPLLQKSKFFSLTSQLSL